METKNFEYDSPPFWEEIREKEMKALNLFKIFFDEEFVQIICDESGKYATLKVVHNPSVLTREMYIYLRILLL